MSFLRSSGRRPTGFHLLEEPVLCYVACMVLGGVGDCLGYRNGMWEFERDGSIIHSQLTNLGGLEKLSPKGFKVSDDTVMLVATARALVHQEQEKVKKKAAKKTTEENKIDLYLDIAREYVVCMEDMSGRSPGITCIKGANQLRPNDRDGYIIPYNVRGAGCGAAMRYFLLIF
jgi:ADP-ribosylarginine hydrolase